VAVESAWVTRKMERVVAKNMAAALMHAWSDVDGWGHDSDGMSCERDISKMSWVTTRASVLLAQRHDAIRPTSLVMGVASYRAEVVRKS
jgi:hypothetical protein